MPASLIFYCGMLWTFHCTKRGKCCYSRFYNAFHTSFAAEIAPSLLCPYLSSVRISVLSLSHLTEPTFIAMHTIFCGLFSAPYAYSCRFQPCIIVSVPFLLTFSVILVSGVIYSFSFRRSGSAFGGLIVYAVIIFTVEAVAVTYFLSLRHRLATLTLHTLFSAMYSVSVSRIVMPKRS